MYCKNRYLAMALEKYVFMFFILIFGDNFFTFFILANCVRDECCREKNSINFSKKRSAVSGATYFCVYILSKSENAILQYFIFCEKVLDKNIY